LLAERDGLVEAHVSDVDARQHSCDQGKLEGGRHREARFVIEANALTGLSIQSMDPKLSPNTRVDRAKLVRD
jgi:hypothetical protein